MNRLPLERRASLLGLLVEGNSLRAATRLTGVSINTVSKLLAEVGAACAQYQDEHLRSLPARRVQCAEIWAFCYAKKKNVTPEIAEKHPDAGDVWTWTAIDAETKLVPSWRVGPRDLGTAYDFMHDLADRLSSRVQLTTDGFKVYLEAVESAFNLDVDYAILQKIYGADPQPDQRSSPAVCLGCKVDVVAGAPDPEHISTSYVERQNLTMRMSMRRFTRLTNGFSKKVDNHAAAVALHFMHYNFARIHKSLRITPAMAAGVTDHVWSLEEIARFSN